MRTTAGFAVLCFVAFLIPSKAWAVPAFARQTGLSCNVCHSNAPALTAFGRNFKLRGYLLNDLALDKVGANKDLQIYKQIPISFMLLISDTEFQANAPATQNTTVAFPQQLSIFLAGSLASHFGALAQLTYTHSDDHFGMDNTDLRFANSTTLAGKSFDYGITINNNPTVEDLWNSTPAWGFPYISSGSTVGPIASPVINSQLGQDVAGVGAYSMWDNHLYTLASVYRSEHAGAPTPVSGTGSTYNISGAAPYWRAAWQQSWGANYLMVGTYGIQVNSHPGAVSGPLDRYTDPAIDFQYERPFGANLLDVHGTYIRENSTLNATLAAGGATNLTHHLNTFKIDSTYHWTNKYTATAAYFATTGPADALLYAPAALTGSQNGSPNNAGYILQFAYWPVQNIDINLNYTGYNKFNGAKQNYDGANRNASDDSTVYIALWLLF